MKEHDTRYQDNTRLLRMPQVPETEARRERIRTDDVREIRHFHLFCGPSVAQGEHHG